MLDLQLKWGRCEGRRRREGNSLAAHPPQITQASTKRARKQKRETQEEKCCPRDLARIGRGAWTGRTDRSRNHRRARQNATWTRREAGTATLPLRPSLKPKDGDPSGFKEGHAQRGERYAGRRSKLRATSKMKTLHACRGRPQPQH